MTKQAIEGVSIDGEGIMLMEVETGITPQTPRGGRWMLYFKPAGAYFITPVGVQALIENLPNKDAASGYAGLNASSRITKGVDTTDDVIIDLATKGLVLKDTQGTPHYWRITIDNVGALVITDVGTTKP